MKSNVQLLAYRFDPGAEFQGQLVGALERIESAELLNMFVPASRGCRSGSFIRFG